MYDEKRRFLSQCRPRKKERKKEREREREKRERRKEREEKERKRKRRDIKVGRKVNCPHFKKELAYMSEAV